MTNEKEIIVVGCGAAGSTAAQFARKNNRKSKITIIEKGKYPQYSKCGIPYAISGDIPQVMDLIEFSEEWFKKNKIDLLLETKVEKIDTDKKIIYASKKDKKIKKHYDSLVISTGAKPKIPPIKNLFNDDRLVDGVFVVRTIDDAKNIKSNISKNKNVMIVGAGFIGLEMADNLYKKGLNVSIVEALPNILPTVFDEDMSRIVLDKIPEDIKIFTNHIATKIDSKNNKINSVFIKDKKSEKKKNIPVDILIIATGCKPNVSLVKKAGCNIGDTGGIIVNKKSETDIKDIYAAGDCTEYIDFVTHNPMLVGLGSIAVRQGIAAGVNASGGEYNLLDGFLQTSTSEFFDFEVASVGALSNCFDKKKVVNGKYKGSSLPHYYPGGKNITIKLIVDKKTGKIFGAQAIGDKAAQRINTFATAILGGIKINSLRKLETAYAPPIAPTLDAETLVCDIVFLKLNRRR